MSKPKSQTQKVTKEAQRDAFEYARSQMATGEGAGNRRKLIRATVEGKAERDPLYAAAFELALKNQDMAEHASRARTERKRRDLSSTAGKNVRALNRMFNGPFAPLSAATLIGVWQAAKANGYDKKIMAYVNATLNKIT